MASQPTILVTGASGFVGQALLSMLPATAVRVAIRSASKLMRSVDSVVIGDVDGRTSWGHALDNVECVVHLAARVHVMNPKKDDHRLFYETNVLGTERLALVAAAKGVRRFVFLSSIKVNGEATGDKPFSASSTPFPREGYGGSKYQAEKRLFQIAAQSNMSAVAIRSPLVYGPGVRANFRRLLSMIDRGVPLPLGAIKNARSLVSVWNLCDLIRTAIEAPSLRSGVLMVSDGKDLSTPELIRRIAQFMGRTDRLFPVPVSMLKTLGRLTGKTEEFSRLCDSLTVDISATQRELNWAPPMSVDESLERTVQWYLREGKTSAH